MLDASIKFYVALLISGDYLTGDESEGVTHGTGRPWITFFYPWSTGLQIVMIKEEMLRLLHNLSYIYGLQNPFEFLKHTLGYYGE